jgi:hypothetical protein
LLAQPARVTSDSATSAGASAAGQAGTAHRKLAPPLPARDPGSRHATAGRLLPKRHAKPLSTKPSPRSKLLLLLLLLLLPLEPGPLASAEAKEVVAKASNASTLATKRSTEPPLAAPVATADAGAKLKMSGTAPTRYAKRKLRALASSPALLLPLLLPNAPRTRTATVVSLAPCRG